MQSMGEYDRTPPTSPLGGKRREMGRTSILQANAQCISRASLLPLFLDKRRGEGEELIAWPNR